MRLGGGALAAGWGGGGADVILGVVKRPGEIPQLPG